MAKKKKSYTLYYISFLVLAVGVGLIFYGNPFVIQNDQANAQDILATSTVSTSKPAPLVLDKADYDKRMLVLANNPSVATTTASSTPVNNLWPAKTVYPNGGAILPFKRIVAYYGNFYSKQMGILGEYSEEEVLKKLRAQVKQWEEADPSTPVVPAIDYIAITAQASAGKDGKYRLRMPDSQVDKALALAEKVNGIVILELQIGLSTLEAEMPVYEKYLKMPNVHLALDPEFAMKKSRPGLVIGTLSAKEINYAAEYLAKLVRENNLPPKVLIVHRFTQPMVTDTKNIKPLPEVQVVIDMDGWGSAERKKNTYFHTIYKEPVQFAGFKVFYKNDLKEGDKAVMTPAQILKLRPKPIFIQYQ